LADHAILDVTPTITGASGNQNYIYAFTVEAQRMRLRVYEGMNDLTHRTTENWIGANVALTATLEGREAFENAGVTVALANVSWAVPTTKAFDFYYHDIGVLDEIFPTDQPSVNFHWRDAIDPATVSVSAQAIVNGTAFALGPAPTQYKVNRPNPGFSAARTGTIQVIDGTLSFGTIYDHGITFTATFSPIGEWDFFQVVHASEVLVQKTSGCTLKTTSGADGEQPYEKVPFPNGLGFNAFDSPNILLPNDAYRVRRTDIYKSWLMFRPPDGCYVPVKKMNWGWSGTAIKSGSAWIIDLNDPPVDSIGQSDHTTVFPVWTSYVNETFTITTVPCP
jgi:hypothetical protein